MGLLISYKYNFLFIHIVKTAGSSITYYLAPYARFIDRFAYGYWITRKTLGMLNRLLGWKELGYKPYTGFLKHGTVLDAKNTLSEEVFKSLFKFAFVRNPWDWRVSLYFYIRQTPKHDNYDIISNMSFSDFIKWDVLRKPKRQVDFVCDLNNHIIVDYIGRYENLHEDFEIIKKKLSIKHSKSELPQINVSKNREFKDYRKYYNDETRSLVGDYFRDDIEKFGYKFE